MRWQRMLYPETGQHEKDLKVAYLFTANHQLCCPLVMADVMACYAHYVREYQRSAGWGVQICTFQELITMSVRLISPMQFIQICSCLTTGHSMANSIRVYSVLVPMWQEPRSLSPQASLNTSHTATCSQLKSSLHCAGSYAAGRLQSCSKFL